MDFFEHQAEARKQTTKLVVLFVLAVFAIVASAYLVVGTVFIFVDVPGETVRENLQSPYGGAIEPGGLWERLLRPRYILSAGTLTLFVVALASFWKWSMLRRGGAVVAEALGGRLVPRNTVKDEERVLLNVVDEMALAAGIPAPAVYVMDGESHINAFAAGHTVDDAVIGVTQGALAKLSREKLQGVIAHEYSHILHGDMALNLKLIGVLHGLLVIGLIGQTILRATLRSRGRSSRDKGGGILAAALAGFGLMVVGYAGTFFGGLIRAAVSRQREFLADASSVQYTRNPAGIAGALRAIAEDSSAVLSPRAAEAAHMFFGDIVARRFLGMLATHPPIDERIRRVEGPLAELPRTGHGGGASGAAHAGAMGFAGGSAAAAIASVGEVRPEAVAHAARLLGGIPGPVRAAVAYPHGALAAVYAAVLSPDTGVRAAQLAALEASADGATYAQTVKLAEHMIPLTREQHMAAVDLAIPALRSLSDGQYRAFRRDLAALVAADGRIDLFEWMLEQLVVRHVAPTFEGRTPTRVRFHSLGPLTGHLSVLLSTVAYAGAKDDGEAAAAFAEGARILGLHVERLPAASCALTEVGRATEALRQVAPMQKRTVVAAVAATALADGHVGSDQAQLLRAVADALECPMPPLVPTSPLAA